MPANLDDADRWRALATEALDAAEQMTDPETRRMMLFIAEAYKRLVRHAEKRKDRNK